MSQPFSLAATAAPAHPTPIASQSETAAAAAAAAERGEAGLVVVAGAAEMEPGPLPPDPLPVAEEAVVNESAIIEHSLELQVRCFCRPWLNDSLFIGKSQQEKDSVQHSRGLPVMNHRREVLDAVWANRVVVISGETGCGKTTQVSMRTLDPLFVTTS